MAGQGLDLLLNGRAQALTRAMPGAESHVPTEAEQDRTARDFAAVLYSAAVRQMQRTIGRDEEEDAMAEGVRDFFGLFLPRALAQHRQDGLSRYLRRQLAAHYGEASDGRS
jgi:hypothetical protein